MNPLPDAPPVVFKRTSLSQQNEGASPAKEQYQEVAGDAIAVVKPLEDDSSSEKKQDVSITAPTSYTHFAQSAMVLNQQPQRTSVTAREVSKSSTSMAASVAANTNIPTLTGLARKRSPSEDSQTSMEEMHQFVSDSLSQLVSASRKNWNDGLTPEQLKSFSTMEVKRQQFIWELFVTEAAYVQDLAMVQEVSY